MNTVTKHVKVACRVSSALTPEIPLAERTNKMKWVIK